MSWTLPSLQKVCAEDEGLEKLRQLIMQEPDVNAVHRLYRLGEHSALYLIETPFETFPRFVVGCASLDNELVDVLCRCNKLATAEGELAELIQQHFEANASAPD